MKNKRFNIFIIAVLLMFLAGYSGGLNAFGDGVVYASDEENQESGEWQQVGDYKYQVIQTYSDVWPEGIAWDIKYENISKYPVWPYYIVNLNGDRQRVYQGPSKDSRGIDRLFYGERCKVLELIINEDGEQWYIFITKIEGEDAIAFIPVKSVALRQFRLEEMYNNVQNVAGLGSIGPVVYIDNYRDLNGKAPVLPSGEYFDPYGYRRGQSATGYYDKSLTGDFRYIPDGALCIVEEIIDITDIEDNYVMFNNMGEYVPKTSDPNAEQSPELVQKALDLYNENSTPFAAKVYVPSFGSSFWIESVYIDTDRKMQGGFGQVIVVDRANQNIGVFEYNGGWKLISLSYSTTGKSSSSAVPTPLGYFMAIEKKDLFEYQEEGVEGNAGFAPYAIRFSGGGYLHGIPMVYEYDGNGTRKTIYNYTESILSIGTVPESHMCIRNFTSHAEFMHKWAVIGSCAVAVFE